MILQKNNVQQYFIVIVILLFTGFVTIIGIKCTMPTIKLMIREHPRIKNFENTLLNNNLYTFLDECYSSSRLEQKILCLNYFEMIIHLGENKIYNYENLNEINKAIQTLDQPDTVIDKFCIQLKNVLASVVGAKDQIYTNFNYFDYFMVNDMFCNRYCVDNNEFILNKNTTRRYTRNIICRLLLIGYDLLNNYAKNNNLINIKASDEITKILSCNYDESDNVGHSQFLNLLVIFSCVLIIFGIILHYLYCGDGGGDRRTVENIDVVVVNDGDSELKPLSYINPIYEGTPPSHENSVIKNMEALSMNEEYESIDVHNKSLTYALIQPNVNNNPFEIKDNDESNVIESIRLSPPLTKRRGFNPFEICNNMETEVIPTDEHIFFELLPLTKRNASGGGGSNNPLEIVDKDNIVKSDEYNIFELRPLKKRFSTDSGVNNPIKIDNTVEIIQNDESNVVELVRPPPLTQQSVVTNPFEIEIMDNKNTTVQNTESVVNKNTNYVVMKCSKHDLEIIL